MLPVEVVRDAEDHGFAECHAGQSSRHRWYVRSRQQMSLTSFVICYDDPTSVELLSWHLFWWWTWWSTFCYFTVLLALLMSIAAKLIGYRCDVRHACCFCYEYVPHSECVDSVCRCKAGYYSNRIGNMCIPRTSVLCCCPSRCLSLSRVCCMFSLVVAVVFYRSTIPLLSNACEIS